MLQVKLNDKQKMYDLKSEVRLILLMLKDKYNDDI